jgi:TM2 domain-containing membrane protein YozV
MNMCCHGNAVQGLIYQHTFGTIEFVILDTLPTYLDSRYIPIYLDGFITIYLDIYKAIFKHKYERPHIMTHAQQFLITTAPLTTVVIKTGSLIIDPQISSP